MIRTLTIFIALLGLLTACAGSGGKNDPNDPNNPKPILSNKRRVQAQAAFDLLALNGGEKQWQAAVALRQDFGDVDAFIDSLWGIRTRNCTVAHAIGLTCLQRKGRTLSGVKDDPERAERWLTRAMEEASKTGHKALPIIRYDYARVLAMRGDSAKALNVIGNRSEVEPLSLEIENLYSKLITNLTTSVGPNR